MIDRRRIEFLLTKKKKEKEISPTKEKQFPRSSLLSRQMSIGHMEDNLRQFPFLSHQNLTR